MKLQIHLNWSKKNIKSPIFRIFKPFLVNFWLLVQNKLSTKNVGFQNLMIVLENVYAAQMILNGFLLFFVFSKQIQLSWKCLHKLMIKIDIHAQKVKCFVFVHLCTPPSSCITASRRCDWQYFNPIEQEQRIASNPSLHWGQVHPESGSSPVITDKWRQECLSVGIAHFSYPIYILSRSR